MLLDRSACPERGVPGRGAARIMIDCRWTPAPVNHAEYDRDEKEREEGGKGQSTNDGASQWGILFAAFTQTK